MPEHPLWSQISSHRTSLKHSLTLGCAKSFQEKVILFKLDKVGIWLRLGWCQLMQQNYATAQVGAKRRVWNQGSGEDVGPIWALLSCPAVGRHPRDLVLNWNHFCGRARQVVAAELAERCESILELWSGNVSKHHHLLMTSYEEPHFNLGRHLISISAHVHPLWLRRD